LVGMGGRIAQDEVQTSAIARVHQDRLWQVGVETGESRVPDILARRRRQV